MYRSVIKRSCTDLYLTLKIQYEGNACKYFDKEVLIYIILSYTSFIINPVLDCSNIADWSTDILNHITKKLKLWECWGDKKCCQIWKSFKLNIKLTQLITIKWSMRLHNSESASVRIVGSLRNYLGGLLCFAIGQLYDSSERQHICKLRVRK